MVDENHRPVLIESVSSSTAFCYPLYGDWKKSTTFSGASAVAESRANVFYAARFLDAPQEMCVLNGVVARGETKMNVSLWSESAGLYRNDVGLLRVGFSRAGLQSENASAEGKSSGRPSPLVTLSDVDGLKGGMNLPLYDR